MKLDKRMVSRVVAIAIVVGVLGWQWRAKQHSAKDAADGASAAVASSAETPAKPAAPVKPALPATLKFGRLTLTACELRQPNSAATTPAFCTKFPVPEDQADPKSRTIDLKLAILKSDSALPATDLVVYLAGGPGQSAIQTYPEVAPAFAPLRKHHDVLLLDQRGTGDSHPLKCPGLDKQLKGLGDTQPTIAQRVEWVGQCAQEIQKNADPRYYTTTDAIADLEAVREALGAPKLDLVGVSYGTRVAQHYASAHPDAVRSIVLDGVVPNQLALGETFAEALNHSLKLQAAACESTPTCKKAFGDWYATLHQLYAKLKAGPPRQVTFADPSSYVPVTRTLTADTLAGVARLFSYSTGTAALLPLAVNEAAHGNYAPLMGQSQLLTGDLSESIEGGVQMSVICTEDASLLKPRPQDADLLLGNDLIDAFIAECKAWPHGPMPRGFHAPFESSIPTLLISGERDPVTPPAYAGEVLKGLSNGRSLVAKGLGHAESIDAGCMPDLVEQFIANLEPKRLDAQCLDKIGPIPAFVNFNGAAP
ncbi:MAG TPA: alpha/beta fold hydrolase [Rhodanobacteraceae bacterium]|nr:alpha/beta fold hydrolase [Rhodanobacteraceae bacterium]